MRGQSKRKSSSKINKLMLTHSLFSLFANPIRYIWPLAGASLFAALGFFAYGVVRFIMQEVSVYMLIVSLGFAIIAMILFLFGVLTQQGNMIQAEMWRMKQDIASFNEEEKRKVLGGG